jgi:signal transduction histidine kinase
LLLGLLLVPIAGLAGLLLARRLSLPFSELAGVAEGMGAGRLAVDVPHYRIPEAEAIGRSLALSAARLQTMLGRERQVAVHASHQLRTPITALRLTLEDLALWPETSPEVADELHRIMSEVDRLSDAVATLLEETQGGRMHAAEALDLGALVAETAERWTPVVEAVGLRLDVGSAPRVQVVLPRAGVCQALDLVLQHACEVAADTVTLQVIDRATHVAVDVAFPPRRAGVQDPAADVARREAAEAAAALGGRLIVDSGGPLTELALLLPAAGASGTLS